MNSDQNYTSSRPVLNHSDLTLSEEDTLHVSLISSRSDVLHASIKQSLPLYDNLSTSRSSSRGTKTTLIFPGSPPWRVQTRARGATVQIESHLARKTLTLQWML
ncbi:unnamed protein product [Fusarium venenatum]|uniref:Uncharacterized protein n=1 Tax=Fusarium venenatum TaxID=56646 RepID=A0A2L2TQU2_9HYPO|nr:LOW QUALITY PROTEIN: uncharacterized protein FVRRES_08418 [Fusarium venenatum]CEI68341.1 unnamed protein product [Fusarium venenatum]